MGTPTCPRHALFAEYRDEKLQRGRSVARAIISTRNFTRTWIRSNQNADVDVLDGTTSPRESGRCRNPAEGRLTYAHHPLVATSFLTRIMEFSIKVVGSKLVIATKEMRFPANAVRKRSLTDGGGAVGSTLEVTILAPHKHDALASVFSDDAVSSE